MKIRTGFVSNSSSSSFIIALDKKPKSADELKKMLWEDDKYVGDDYDTISTDVASEFIFNMLKNTKAIKGMKQMLKIPGSLEGRPNFFDYRTDEKIGSPEFKRIFQRYLDDTTCFKEKVFQKFLDKNESRVLYSLEFSDDTLTGSILEHGGVFDYIPYIRLSNH